MDARPRLPHDVLLNVASLADRQSILALLTTARSLHSHCGKYVVQDPVALDGDQDVVSFIYFMRPYKHKRWHHLRSLRLRDAPISSGVARAFAKVIPRASHLRVLVFEDAEMTLSAHPDLPLAFAALRAVEHIAIDHGYHSTCRMLEAMNWPLESAELKHSSDEFTRDCLDRIHPAVLLKNSRATLKTLECEAWSDFDDVLDTYPVYPHLESLHTEGSGCPSIAHWAVCYPNLKRLFVDTLGNLFMKGANEDQLDRYAATRSHNLKDHMAQGQHWVGLEEFVGDTALDLYLLGLPYPIRTVALTLCPASLRFFGPAMETARPTVLALLITSELFCQPVPTYLEGLGLADVKALNLTVMVQVRGTVGLGDMGELDVKVDRFLAHVLGALQRASTKKFSLWLEIDSFDRTLLPDDDDSDSGDHDASHSFEDDASNTLHDQGERPILSPAHSLALKLSLVKAWVNDIDLHALVRRFKDEVPSLDWVKFSVEESFTSCRREAESGPKDTAGEFADTVS